MMYLLVFMGGGLGCTLRYAISLMAQRYYGGVVPVGTFISNVISCAILVLLIELMRRSGVDNAMVKAAGVVGFCGGFSTFSTFGFETVQLIKNGNHVVAVGNIILSVGVCLILIYKLTK